MSEPRTKITFDPNRLRVQAQHFRELAAEIDDETARARLLERASLLDQLAANVANGNEPANAG